MFKLTLLLLLSAPLLNAGRLNVFAAASLADALGELARVYEVESGEQIRLNFAGSGILVRQIQEGAPADVFFSADEARMDELEKAGLVAVDTRRTLLSNKLVIVVHRDGSGAVTEAADLAKSRVGRLALAETQTVPAGIYAREYLLKFGLWDAVSGKVIPTANVRATLATVESGNVDAGIVYKTDALMSGKVRIAYEIPVEEGPAIGYPVAVLKRSENEVVARRFVDFLASERAVAVFARHGFIAVQE